MTGEPEQTSVTAFTNLSLATRDGYFDPSSNYRGSSCSGSTLDDHGTGFDCSRASNL